MNLSQLINANNFFNQQSFCLIALHQFLYSFTDLDIPVDMQNRITIIWSIQTEKC